jgi:RNA polymerase sigma-70 factor (ECF subfamily)
MRGSASRPRSGRQSLPGVQSQAEPGTESGNSYLALAERLASAKRQAEIISKKIRRLPWLVRFTSWSQEADMEFTDQALIQRWQQGDASAFDALVRRWEGRVARFLARYSGSAEQAVDGTQDVFLRVYRAGPRYQPRAEFSTWLFQIALNVARDAARRRRATPLLDGCNLVDPCDPSALAMARETAAEVERAVAALPEPLRLVLVLRHYEGMSFETMSRMCKAPASTLKSRFAVALTKLRSLLGALKPDFEETES